MVTLKDCLLDSVLKRKINMNVPLEKFNVLGVYESDSMFAVLKNQNSNKIVLNNYFVTFYG